MVGSVDSAAENESPVKLEEAPVQPGICEWLEGVYRTVRLTVSVWVMGPLVAVIV